MRPRITRKWLVAAGAALAVGAGTGVVLVTGPAHASSQYGYSGFSHGTYVYNSLAESGPQVASFFGCSRKAGLYIDNDLAAVKMDGTNFAKSVVTKTYTHNDNRGDGTTSYGTAASIKLGSLLEMKGAESFSRAIHKDDGFETKAYSKFAAVKIGGVSVPSLLDPRPNTKVTVPGLGYIVLNRVVNTKTEQSASASSAAVLIHSTVKNKYIPKNSTVAALLTKAAVGGAAPAMLRGQAYTTQAKVGDMVKSGKTSWQTTCMGTNGKVSSDSVAGITIPKVAKVGAANTQHAGTLRSDLVSGWMKSTLAGVNLRDGKVELGAISTRTAATKLASGDYRTSWTTEIASLRIDGKEVPVPKAPNQEITIPGVGKLTFNKVSKQTGYVSVTAVTIELTAVDTVLELGHAESGIISG